MIVDVSICMVSLNCWGILYDCMESLSKSNATETYEIIIVDNASTDATPQLIREHYPQVKLIQNARNVGFTRATNQAIKLSAGRCSSVGTPTK